MRRKLFILRTNCHSGEYLIKASAFSRHRIASQPHPTRINACWIAFHSKNWTIDRPPRPTGSYVKTREAYPRKLPSKLHAIRVDPVVGLHERALIATMLYSFARASAVVGMQVQEYYPQGKRSWIRFHEKGGKFHEVPCHHKAEEYLDAYLESTDLRKQLHANYRVMPFYRTFKLPGHIQITG